MTTIQNWHDESMEVARSSGGVLAAVNPWQNVISTGVRSWPSPALIQKIYQSRQVRAFSGDEHRLATATFGFYSDLQSIHSEDAITWSVFGSVIYADSTVREAFARDLLKMIGLSGTAANAHIWLWRRLPHPDRLVPGGPEIDFGVQTDDVFLLGEAKWRSSVGAAQGVNKDKDQDQVTPGILRKVRPALPPKGEAFRRPRSELEGGITTQVQRESAGVCPYARDFTWRALAEASSHSCQDELRRYLNRQRYGIRSQIEVVRAPTFGRSAPPWEGAPACRQCGG